jgi:hypothetical protein
MIFRMCAWILTWRYCEGCLFWVWNLGRTSLDLYVFLWLGLEFGFGFWGVFLYCILGFRSFPNFPSILFASLLSAGYWDLEDSGPSFVFSSLPPNQIGLSTLFGTPRAKGGALARDLAQWLFWCLAQGLGMRPGAYAPHWPRLPPC